MIAVLLRAGAAAVAGGGLTLAVVLAANYPTQPLMIVAAAVVWAMIVFAQPGAWLLVVPAVLPVVGFAPWTGWLTFEEIDILVLAAAAGGYARLAADARRWVATEPHPARLSPVVLALVAAFAASVALSLARGLAAAGDFRFGWFHGYGEALNSLRVAKSYALALLLLPLLVVELRASTQRATGRLAAGMALGLGAAALAVVWERLVFADLLDFSSDYRVTGLFWEMHVGGAALDGFLALTVPFAAWQLVRAKGPLRLAAALALAALAGYACLATFSRGLYAAVPVSLAVMLLLLVVRREGALTRAILFSVVRWTAAGIVAIGAAALVFRAGGYRSVMAVLAVLAVLLPLRGVVRALTPGAALAAGTAGVVVGGVAMVAGPLFHKGVYVIFGLTFAACAAGIARYRMRGGAGWAAFALAAYVVLVAAAANVAWFWGGWPAFRDALPVLGGLLGLAVWNARSAQPLWPESLRVQAAMFGSATLLAGVVAVFAGGAYMGGRFAATEHDLGGRLAHWSGSLALMQSAADWLVGRGAGRYPADFAAHGPAAEIPGAYRLTNEEGTLFLALHGPGKPTGTGQTLRIAQRIPLARGEKYAVVIDVRARRDTALLVELCEKNLLYSQGCANAVVTVRPLPDGWRRMVVPLDGSRLAGGRWQLPMFGLVSLAVDTSRSVVDIRQVSVFRSDGRDLIENGDWSDETAHWFITSDREHLPWHIKNLLLHVLFDQGLFGLVLFASLVGTALWRVAFGAARAHPIAPALAASIVGFVIVGLFDSLLDVPRLALLFFVVVLTSLALAPGARNA